MLYNNGFEELYDELMAELSPFLVIMEILFIVAMFIFKGIAIYTVAGKKGIENKWLAFIPFVNWLLLGKVIGRVKLWGHELKNLGFWVAVTAAADFVISFMLNYNSYVYIITNLFGVKSALPLIDTNSITYLIITLLSYIVSIAYIFFEVNIIFATFRIYIPEKALLFSLLSIFLEIFGVLFFAVRNREEVTYEEYVKRKFASYNSTRSNGEYNGNGSRTSTGYENPFPEFDDDTKGNGGNNGTNNDEDDLFN